MTAPSQSATGHRERLWQRLLQQGFRAGFVHTYERLEFLLTFVQPRRDTKQLAKRLLDRFGSLNDVLRAPVAELRTVEGVGEKVAAFLSMLHELDLSLQEERLHQRDQMQDRAALRAYLQSEFAWERSEMLVVVFLDSRDQFLHRGRIFRGTIDQVVSHPREIIKEALALNAVRLIIAHNHPSGDPTPSWDDVQMTQQLARALQLVEMVLVDHIIVGRQGSVSMRDTGHTWAGVPTASN